MDIWSLISAGNVRYIADERGTRCSWYDTYYFHYFLCSIPFIVFALLFLSLLVLAQIRGHIARSSPPSPVLCTGIRYQWYTEYYQ